MEMDIWIHKVLMVDEQNSQLDKISEEHTLKLRDHQHSLHCMMLRRRMISYFYLHNNLESIN